MHFQWTGTETSGASADNKMSVEKAHSLFGHGNEDSNRKTAKALDIELTRRTLPSCASCAAAKAQQKAIVKNVECEPSKVNNGRIHTDDCTLHRKNDKGGRVWVSNGVWNVKVDERTGMKFWSFHQTKDGIAEPSLEKFNKWKQNGVSVLCIRWNGAGENKKMKAQSESADWKMNMTWELTARNTPQQNHSSKLGFTKIANCHDAWSKFAPKETLASH